MCCLQDIISQSKLLNPEVQEFLPRIIKKNNLSVQIQILTQPEFLFYIKKNSIISIQVLFCDLIILHISTKGPVRVLFLTLYSFSHVQLTQLRGLVYDDAK